MKGIVPHLCPVLLSPGGPTSGPYSPSPSLQPTVAALQPRSDTAVPPPPLPTLPGRPTNCHLHTSLAGTHYCLPSKELHATKVGP